MKLLLITIALIAFTSTSFGSTIADDLVDIIKDNDQFSTLESLVLQADLVDFLRDIDSVTVFAPTNDAFAKLPAETLEAVKNNKSLLVDILSLHVAFGAFSSGVQIIQYDSLKTYNPVQDLTIGGAGNKAVIENAGRLIFTQPFGVKASNGIIFPIEDVLLLD